MGANDTLTTIDYWDIELGFTDGDYRKIKVPDPAPFAGESDIRDLDTWIKTNQPVIGDKTGASTTGINAAFKVMSTRIKLDLT